MPDLSPDMRLWRAGEVCRVVNKYRSDFDINIQRGSIWGNPYTVEEYGDQAIPLFDLYWKRLLIDKKITKQHLEVLRGMRLGCTCYPHQCHGDIIAKPVNQVFKDDFNLIEDLM